MTVQAWWATYSAVRDLAVYKGDALPHSKMDFMMFLKKVENECAMKSFEESTAHIPQLRAQLAMSPSDVIQARISFDAAGRMDLTMMSPLQMQRLVTLKQDLIQILQNQ